ncbi:MAG: hypothetical protein H0T47_23625 [Planctomycetaceae bacterium]|nr:hypothetical protein [Planctomycetaceae bacterium]
MPSLIDFNPLKSIAIPNIGRVVPNGLVLVIGPNSAGKTQLLRDVQGRVLGKPRELVVCDEIEISRPPSLSPLLDVLLAENHISRRVDNNNNLFIDTQVPEFGGDSSNWSLLEGQVQSYFAHPVSIGKTRREGISDKFLG